MYDKNDKNRKKLELYKVILQFAFVFFTSFDRLHDSTDFLKSISQIGVLLHTQKKKERFTSNPTKNYQIH